MMVENENMLNLILLNLIRSTLGNKISLILQIVIDMGVQLMSEFSHLLSLYQETTTAVNCVYCLNNRLGLKLFS